jgi:hypothetical protein
MLFDGFDDDYVPPARETRRALVDGDGLTRGVATRDAAVVAHGVWTLPPPPPPPPRRLHSLDPHRCVQVRVAGADGDAPWLAACRDVATAGIAIASGRYLDALSTGVAAALLAPVTAEEVAALPSPPSAQGVPFSTLVALFHGRVGRWVTGGQLDALVDGDGGRLALQPFRALAVSLLAGALTDAFVQANWTGPEFSPAALTPWYPLPFAASLLTAPADGDGGGSGDAASLHTHTSSAVAAPAWAKLAPEALSLSPFQAKPGGEGAGEEGSEEDPATDAELEAVMAPALARRSRLDRWSLRCLQWGGTTDAFEQLELPHFLVTARALHVALLGGDGSSATALSAAVHDTAVAAAIRASTHAAAGSEGADGGGADTAAARARATFERDRKVAAAVAHWWLAPWLAGRAAVVHQRCLVDRAANRALVLEATRLYRAAAAALTPAYLATFAVDDVFIATLVDGVLAETAAMEDGSRAAVLGGAPVPEPGSSPAGGPPISPAAAAGAVLDAAGTPDAALAPVQRAFRADPAAPAAVRVALLLEWGQAQVTFGAHSAAKTAFLLAKADSGIKTQLTGGE